MFFLNIFLNLCVKKKKLFRPQKYYFGPDPDFFCTFLFNFFNKKTKTKKNKKNIYIYIYACSLVYLVWALWHGLDDTTCVRSLGVAIKPYLHPRISTALMRPRRPKQYCLQLVIYIYMYIYITITSLWSVNIEFQL